MGVVVVFEPASDAHWMKDVVQFPNALSQMLYCKNATLLTRPNHRQEVLSRHIEVKTMDDVLIENISCFEHSDFSFSKLKTSNNWYLNACKEAAKLGRILILFPWYGDPFMGARKYKLQRWIRLKKARVVLKSDGLFQLDSHIHNKPNGALKDFFRYFFIDQVICENRDIFQRLVHTRPSLRSKLVYIPNCTLDLFHSAKERDFKLRPKNFLFVGRISDWEKGVDILLESWLGIFQRLKDWKLQLVGPCDEGFEAQWKSQLIHAHAEESVIWYSAASPSEILDLYRNSKIVILSSRKEGSPLVPIEAALTGCAFIGTAVGEITSLLEGMKGLVRDPAILGNTMLLFANNEELAANEAITLKQRVSDRSWSTQVKKLRKIIK